ncbi:agarase [Pseudonocardia alni subsp. carboxydivorans]|uniref:Agarase n=1 Tax=Pseudonocardia alni subsp. carboxydivorans TaxID=415010 RepID=A0ABU9AKX0_PSEA5
MATFAVRDGRLVDPDGKPFLSLALNHVDETNLKFPYNRDIWRERYGSRERWIADGAVADLRNWSFNTLGWTQEYVAGGWGEALDWFGDPIDLKHSTPWSATELRGAGIPYVAQVPVQEIEDWNGYPAFRPMDPAHGGDDFAVWCDYLARSIAAEHADSPDLLGYFLVDIPAWLPHASGADFAELQGLDAAEREKKLYDVASRYYETIVTAIRRYDPDHLILGDRFNGNKGIPEPVLRAMEPFVDVLSVQYFTEPTEESRTQLRADLARWREQCGGKPVIVADAGNWTPTELNPHREGLPDHAARGVDYGAALDAVLDEPWFAGWHWCGYVENTGGRGWGLKDPWDEPYRDLTDAITEHNRRALAQHGKD